MLGQGKDESQLILKYLWKDRPALEDVIPALLLGP